MSSALIFPIIPFVETSNFSKNMDELFISKNETITASVSSANFLPY